MIYLEQYDRSLRSGGLSILAGTSRHQQIMDSDATIEVWAGSDREADYNAAKALSDWKASRAVAVSRIAVEVDGMIFDGDEISQGRMARAVIAADSDSEATVWVLANNTPAQVTASQLKQALRLAGAAQTALWVNT